ncbi:hypothetical protein GH5_05555 [Leishmania sp. Ghana 2012 LV757]|uniref:hypothetical protein n=1 Tax=Leishmania sp. Ghana 2012 LV757 TaxID=2803181 RepID=UPI001B748207|nr:hypothetical protein GH5_05555 [Leishmania sp. Ghana 2012 LV757]
MHNAHHREIDRHLDRIEDYLRGMVRPPRARYDTSLLDQVLRLAFLPASSTRNDGSSYPTTNQQAGLRVSVVYDAPLSSAGLLTTVVSASAAPPPMRKSTTVRTAAAPCMDIAQPLPPPPPRTSPVLFTATQPSASSSAKPSRTPAKAAPPRITAIASVRTKRPFFLSLQEATPLHRRDCSNSSSSSTGTASVSNYAAASSPLLPTLRPPPPLPSLQQSAAVADEQSPSVATRRPIYGSRSPSPLTPSLDKSQGRSMELISHGLEERLRPPPQLWQSQQQQDIGPLPSSSSHRGDRRGAHPTPPLQSGNTDLLHHRVDDAGTRRSPDDITRHIATATSSAPEEQLSSLLSSLGDSPTSYETPFRRRLRHLDRLLDGAAHDDSTFAPHSSSRHVGVYPSRGTRRSTEQQPTQCPDLPAAPASSTERQLLPLSGRDAAGTSPVPATTQPAHISSEHVGNKPDERLHSHHPYPARLERATRAAVAAPPRLGAPTGADAPTPVPRDGEDGAADGSCSSDASPMDVDAPREREGWGVSASGEGLCGSERDRGIDRSSATVSQDAEGDVSAASNAFRATGRHDSPTLFSPQQQQQQPLSVGSASSELERLPLVRVERDLFVSSCCGRDCVNSETVVGSGRCLATLLWARRQGAQVAEKLRSLRRRERQHRQCVVKREVEGRYAIRLLEASDAADAGPDWLGVADDDTATATSFTLSCSPSWFAGQWSRRVEGSRRSATSESRMNEHLADEAAVAEVNQHQSRSRSGRTLVSSRSSMTAIDEAGQQRDVQRAPLVGREAPASVLPLEAAEGAAALANGGGGTPPSTAMRPSSSNREGARGGSIEPAVEASVDEATHEAAPAPQGGNDTALHADMPDASTLCPLPTAEGQSSPPSHLWTLDKGVSEVDSREEEEALLTTEGDIRRRGNGESADIAHVNDGSRPAGHSAQSGGSGVCGVATDNDVHATTPSSNDEKTTISTSTSSAEFMVWRNAAQAHLSPSASTEARITGTEAAADGVGNSDASAATAFESLPVSLVTAADDAAEHISVAWAGMAHAPAGGNAVFLVSAEVRGGGDGDAARSRNGAADEDDNRGRPARPLEALERAKMPSVREKDGAVAELDNDDCDEPRPSHLTPQPADLSPLPHATTRASVHASAPASGAATAMTMSLSVTMTTPSSHDCAAQHSTACRSPEPASVAARHSLDEEQPHSRRHARTASSSVATSGSFFCSLPSQGPVRTASSHETPEKQQQQTSNTGEIISPVPRRTEAAPAPHAARRFPWKQPRTDRGTEPMAAGTSFPREPWRCGHTPNLGGRIRSRNDRQGHPIRSDTRHWASDSANLAGGAPHHSTATAATPKQLAVSWTISLDWAEDWSVRDRRNPAAADAASSASDASSIFPAVSHRDARASARTAHRHRKTQSGAPRRRLPPHLRPDRPWARLLTRGLRPVYYSTSSGDSTDSSERRGREARAQAVKHTTGPGGEPCADAGARADSFDSLLSSSTPSLAATLSAIPRRSGPWYATPARRIKKEHHVGLAGLSKAASRQPSRPVRSGRGAQYPEKGRCAEAGARAEAGSESADTRRESASPTVAAAHSAAARSKALATTTTHAASGSRWPAGLAISPSSARARKLQRTASAPTYWTAEAACTIAGRWQRLRHQWQPAGPTYVQLHEKRRSLRRSASATVWRPMLPTGALTEGDTRARQSISARKADGAGGGGSVTPRSALVWRLTGAPRPRPTEERCAAQQQEESVSLRLSAADLCGGVGRNVSSSAPTGAGRRADGAAESTRTSGVAGVPPPCTVTTAPRYAPAATSVKDTAEQGVDDGTTRASAASSNAAIPSAVAEATGRDAGVDVASWAAMAPATADGKSAAPTPACVIPVQALSPSARASASTGGEVVAGGVDGHPRSPHSPAGESDGNPERLDVRDQVTSAAHPSELTLGIPSLMCGDFSEAPEDSLRSNLPACSSGLHRPCPSTRFTSNFPSAVAAAAEDEDGMQGRGETGQRGESDGESLSGTNSDAGLGKALCNSAPTPPPQHPPGLSRQRTLADVTPIAASTVADPGHHHAAKTTQELLAAFAGSTPVHRPLTKPLSPSPPALELAQAALREASEMNAAELVESYACRDAAAQCPLQQNLAERLGAAQALTRTECGHIFVTPPVSTAGISHTAVGSADACAPETAANPHSRSGAAGQSPDAAQQADGAETRVDEESLSRPNAEAAPPFIFSAPLVTKARHVGHSAPSAQPPSSPAEGSSAAAFAAKRLSAAVGVSPVARHTATPAPAVSVDTHHQPGAPSKHQRSRLCLADESPVPPPQSVQLSPQPTLAAAPTARAPPPRAAESRAVAARATIDRRRATPPPPEQQQRREVLEHRIAQLEVALLLRQQPEQGGFSDGNGGGAEEASADYCEVAMDGDEDGLWSASVRGAELRSRNSRFSRQGMRRREGADGVGGHGPAVADKTAREASTQAQRSTRSVPVPASAIHWTTPSQASGGARTTGAVLRRGGLHGFAAAAASSRGDHENRSGVPAVLAVPEAIPAAPAPGASTALYTRLADRRYGLVPARAVATPADPRYSRATASFLISAEWRYQRIYVDNMYFPKAAAGSASQGGERTNSVHEEGSRQLDVARSAPEEGPEKGESKPTTPAAAVWCASSANNRSADVFACRPLH